MSSSTPTPELRARLAAIVADLGLLPAEDPRVDDQVHALCAHMDQPAVWTGTTDERAVPYLTIDNPGSRDLDQALHVARDGEGFVVRYAIADAAYFVPIDESPLWDRALAQGSSYYLPTGSIPMLPAPLSEGIVSLNPGVERRALRFAMRLDAEGRCSDVDVARVRMRSRAQLSYEGVQAFRDGLDSDEARRVHAALAETPALAGSLDAFFDAGERLVAAAEARDTTPVDRVESEIHVDPEHPDRLRVIARERNQVERYNEQVSLLFNIEGAELLSRYSEASEQVQAVFRVHLPPLTERLDDLGAILHALSARRGLDARWRWSRRGGDLGHFVRALPDEPSTARLRHAVLRQVRYTFRSSSFRARSGPHHALGVDGYARLSAPMREAVGIFTHKELLEGLGLAEPRDPRADAETRELVIASANLARQKQRALDKAVDLVAIEQLLRDDLARPLAGRPWRLGTVVGLRTTRVYVALDGFAVDLKVYRQDLEASAGESLTFVDEVAFVGASSNDIRYLLGDGVELRVSHWDTSRGRFALECRRRAEPAP